MRKDGREDLPIRAQLFRDARGAAERTGGSWRTCRRWRCCRRRAGRHRRSSCRGGRRIRAAGRGISRGPRWDLPNRRWKNPHRKRRRLPNHSRRRNRKPVFLVRADVFRRRQAVEHLQIDVLGEFLFRHKLHAVAIGADFQRGFMSVNDKPRAAHGNGARHNDQGHPIREFRQQLGAKGNRASAFRECSCRCGTAGCQCTSHASGTADCPSRT